MKNKFLLIISLFISTLALGQTQCGFTHSTNGTLNTVSFLPNVILPHPPYYYTWTFGDGTESHNIDPVHTYNVSGFFTACLSIYDSLNQTILCQWCDTFTIANPSGGGQCTWTMAGTGNTRTFHGYASTSNTDIHWDFGNGSTGIGAVYTYTYPAPGTYLVCMYEVDLTGDTVCHLCDHVSIVGTSTNCSFTFTTDTTTLFAQFFANVDAGSTVTWNFGDNTAGTGIDPHHTYTHPGTYVVCMTSILNSVVCHYCDTVYMGASTTNNCSFTASSGPANPTMAEFHGYGPQTGGMIFTWSFGDGSSDGHGAVETHQYPVAGTYQVCLTVTDSITGAILCVTCDQVTVNGNSQGCTANFISTSLALTAYFIDLSNLTSATYYWSFGDGTYSDAHFPHHTYSTPGTYNVCLTVAANGCTGTTCLPVTVDTVVNTNPVCEANFAIVQVDPFEFAVVNLSSGVNLTFDWDFGDGAHSDAAYPSHHYTSIGVYVLCLTVGDPLLCSSTFCDTLTVDSLGNIAHRGMSGFNINVVSPAFLTGVPEVSSPAVISVYPNPVSSTLTVSVMNEMKGAVSYSIVSLDGREISNGIFSKQLNTLDVSGWSSGAYILEIRNGEGFKTYRKIIKE